MKIKIALLLVLGSSVLSFAQKSEIKAAEKALKKGDPINAKTILNQVVDVIDAADTGLQAQYYALLGEVYYNLTKEEKSAEFQAAIEAYKKVIVLEETDGKEKYTQKAVQQLSQISRDLVNSAIQDNNNQDFEKAAGKLYMSYTLSPSDTTYLYHAAGSAVNAQNYDKALAYYNELKNLNYDGSRIVYTAVNIATEQVETMDKKTRDLYVKAGTHKDPKAEKISSKKAEIIKNIALLYQQLGNTDQALAAYTEARTIDPENVNLILGEANLRYTLGDKTEFKTLMAEAATMDPGNPDLLYNIGVINMEQDRIEEARNAYQKVLAIDPGYINALLNLSTTYIKEGNALIDIMNSLGYSKADTARYEELKQKKNTLFQQGADILEDALENYPENLSILTQLKNIYGALGDTQNQARLKKMMEQ